MISLFLFLAFATQPLSAERFTLDPSARSFDTCERPKQRVDVYDFAGEFPELENIEIDARRKKNVEFYLTGDYPALESLTYEGTFGVLKGELTGKFPQLSMINFLCTSCAMNFNLAAKWERSCTITIRGADQNVFLTLPKEVGVVVHTRTSLKGKVVASPDLKKHKSLRLCNKVFENPLAETSPIVLTIFVDTTDGQIVLN